MSASKLKGRKAVTISLDPKLFEELERVVKEMNYKNRSQALKEMIRSFIKEIPSEDEEVFAILCLVYDHHNLRAIKGILEVQHDNQEMILFSSHVHIDEGCMEIIVTKGPYSQLIDVQNKLRVIEGVKIVTETKVSPVSHF